MARHEEEGPEGSSPRQDVHFDPWMTPVSETLCGLADAIFLETEKAAPKLSRQRRDAMERRRAVTTCLLANLTRVWLEVPQGGRLALSLKNTSLTRYDRRDFPREVIRLAVDRLEAARLVSRYAGRRGRDRTALEPTEALKARLRPFGLTLGDIVRKSGGEAIVLKEAGIGRDGQKALVDYAETAETGAMRAEMEEINAALAGADIRLAGERRLDTRLVRMFQIDAGETHHFDAYGRLYRGFWQPLEKTKRQFITIGGRPVVDLDWASCFVNLAYHHQGLALPEGDPYCIPGLEGYREGVKKAVSMLFSRHGPLRRLSDDLGSLLPAGWTARQLMAAISEAHPGIVPTFGVNIAPSFTRTESDLMVAVLLRLIAQGIVALPCHDGLLVADVFKADAAAAMRAIPAERLGVSLTVEEKRIWRPEFISPPMPLLPASSR